MKLVAIAIIIFIVCTLAGCRDDGFDYQRRKEIMDLCGNVPGICMETVLQAKIKARAHA